MYQTFPEDIEKMNAMYQLAPINTASWMAMQQRLEQFEDILTKECAEITDIQVQNETADDDNSEDVALTTKVMMADLLGDLIVYCASEAARWGIPLPNVLQLIMLSNRSKLGEDGQPIINPENGKFEKGPNYWKPEPAIRHLLTEVPFGGQVVVLEDSTGFPTLLLLNKQQWEDWARAQTAALNTEANLGDSANDNQPPQG